MSSMMVVAAVGVAASVYTGTQASRRAKEAGKKAEEAYGANVAIGKELKARQEKLVDAPLAQKIAELSGSKLTAGGQQGLDRFNYEMGLTDRAIQEQAATAGEGVTGSRELTQGFRRAQGIAGINLADTIKKDQELGGFMQMANQTPAWANVMTGANTQQGNFQENQANQARSEASSAYASAARGLAGLGAMYAMRRASEPTETTTKVNYSNGGVEPLAPSSSAWNNLNASTVEPGLAPMTSRFGMSY